MNLDRATALEICERLFPKGIDELVDRLGAEVEDGVDIDNVDGWCLKRSDGTLLIRLNSKNSAERRRFTLAHEIAHLILDHDQGLCLFIDVDNPRTKEERQANRLASQLLLPSGRMFHLVRDRAIDLQLFKDLTRQVKISDIVAALRFVRAADEFGIQDPTIVRSVDGSFRPIPASRSIDPAAVSYWFQHLTETRKGSIQIPWFDGLNRIVTLLPNINFPTLFYYDTRLSLPPPTETRIRQRDLRVEIFGADETFFNRVNGFIAGNKLKCADKSVEDFTRIVVQKCLDAGFTAEQEILIYSEEFDEWIRLRIIELRSH